MSMQFAPIKYVVPGVIVEGLKRCSPGNPRLAKAGCCYTRRSLSRATASRSAKIIARRATCFIAALEGNFAAAVWLQKLLNTRPPAQAAVLLLKCRVS